MRLVGLTESVEASIANLLDARVNLFRGKGVTITKNMLIFAGAIDEGGLFVEKETVIPVVALNRPRNAADAKGVRTSSVVFPSRLIIVARL